MQNWGGDENAAMKGYLLLAINRMNENSREDTGKNAISEDTYNELMSYLYRTTDDFTTDQAYAYYMAHGFKAGD